MTETESYLIGASLGDGNLSNPNGRAVRLRITLGKDHPQVIRAVESALRATMPTNSVSVIHKKSRAVDLSCYSNRWPNFLGWKVGSKLSQNVRVPDKVFAKRELISSCLRGLIDTDGCVYVDRGYPMVTFASNIPSLTNDVWWLFTYLGFAPNLQRTDLGDGRQIFRLRLSLRVAEFLQTVRPNKEIAGRSTKTSKKD